MKRIVLIVLLLFIKPVYAQLDGFDKGIGAKDIQTDTTFFGTNLSVLDTDVQTALETIDGLDIASTVYTEANYLRLDVAGSMAYETASDYLPRSGTLPMTGAFTVADGLTNAVNSGTTMFLESGASGAQDGFYLNTGNTVTGKTLYVQNNGTDIAWFGSNRGSLGSGNTITQGYAIGTLNTATTNNDLAVGQSNNVSGGSAAIGNSNTSSASYAFTSGFQNTASSNGDVAMGLSNNVGPLLYNIGLGFSNTVGANAVGAVALGISNTASPTSPATAVSIGSTNNVTGANSVGIGFTNTVSGNTAVAIGEKNTVANTSFAIGSTITANNGASALVGKFLSNNAGSAYIFGKGVDASNVLDNSLNKSIYMGVNSTVPSLIITDGGGVGGYGNVILGDSTIYADSSDLVGISTATPSATLDVGGGTLTTIDGTDDLLVKDDIEVDGNLYVESDLVFVGSGSGVPYGHMYLTSANTISIGVADTPTEITSGFISGVVNLTTFGSNHYLSVDKAGTYKIDWTMSTAFDSTPGGVRDARIGIMVNGTAKSEGEAVRTMSNTTDTGASAGTAILALTSGQEVSLFVSNVDNTDDIDVKEANLTIFMVGG